METLLYSVTEDASAAVVGIESLSSNGSTLPMELILLPLFQDNGRLNRVLGGLVPLESAYWIGVDPLVKHKIKSLRLIMPETGIEPEVVEIGANNQVFGRSVPTRTAVNLRVIEGGLSGK